MAQPTINLAPLTKGEMISATNIAYVSNVTPTNPAVGQTITVGQFIDTDAGEFADTTDTIVSVNATTDQITLGLDPTGIFGSGADITFQVIADNAVTGGQEYLLEDPTYQTDFSGFQYALLSTAAAFGNTPGSTFSPALTFTSAAAAPQPSISGTKANQPTADNTSLAPFSGVTIADGGPGQTETVTITLSAVANGSFGNLGTGSYNAATGVYTVSGAAAAVTTAVDGLAFDPTPYETKVGGTVTTGFTIQVTDTAGRSANDSTTSVIATAAALTSTALSNLETGILRVAPITTNAAFQSQLAAINNGSQTVTQVENGLITGDPVLYSTLSALVTIDAYYDATPQSSKLTAVAASTGSPSQIGGFYSATYLHDLGYSDTNVWTIMASQWGADTTSAFYKLYDSQFVSGTVNYSGFISAVYQREFGIVPSAANLGNLVNDVPGVQALLAGGGAAATPIQVVSGIYGYLLYVGQTTPSLTTQYATAASAFLRAAANGTVTYGPELTAEFPPATTAGTTSMVSASAPAPTDPNVITITGSNQLIDPGIGGHTIQFLAGTSADTLVLRPGGEDQIAGFDPDTDVLDVRSLLAGTGLNLIGDVSALSNYLTIVDRGADALLRFDPAGLGGGSTVAVLQGLGDSVTGLQALIAHGAIRIMG